MVNRDIFAGDPLGGPFQEPSEKIKKNYPRLFKELFSDDSDVPEMRQNNW